MKKLKLKKFQRYEPPSRKGNLYYVRLKTPAGLLYKLGFTTLGSVNERFAFNGRGDEKLIDKVILFVYLDDAFDIECRLHEMFEDKIAFSRYNSIPEMPLHNNGQSELYRSDILKLDKDFHGIEGDYRKRGASEEEIRDAVERQYTIEKIALPVLVPIFWIFFNSLAAIFWVIEKVSGFKFFNESEKRKQELKSIFKRINDANDARSDFQRLERQIIIKSFLKSLQDTENTNRHRLICILKSAGFIHAVNYVIAVHPLDLKTIAIYENYWRWESLSRSGSVNWSIELIARFEARFDWITLSSNLSLPWSIDLLTRFENRWHWRSLSANPHLTWCGDLIEQFQKNWNWEELSANENIPWSGELIERFRYHLDWDIISSNEGIPWTFELLNCFKLQLNWSQISSNNSVPFTLELVDYFCEMWNWQSLCSNQSLLITQDFIERYKDFLSWRAISGRADFPWSFEILQRYEESWDWVTLSSVHTLPWSHELISHFEIKWDWARLAGNQALPWTLELLDSFTDRWHTNGKEGNGIGLAGNNPLLSSVSIIRQHSDAMDWLALVQNPVVPWSEELIAEYENQLPWNLLSGSTTIPWTIDLITRFEDRWSWSDYDSCLSSNESLPWSKELIERFSDKWDFSLLSMNKSLPWSLELIERYADRWSWGSLLNNPAMFGSKGELQYLPTMTSSGIDEVMRSVRQQYNKFIVT